MRIFNRIWAINSFWAYYCRISKLFAVFTFRGNTYNYFYHRHNEVWGNERTVEIPIIWNMVKEYCGRRILEIGNVLSYYFSVNHDIVDKYENVNYVINQDIADFQSSNKYDLIVSISTLEHVGWDEEPKDPLKILRAIENLKKMLAPGGRIVVTLPLGYNAEMDKLIKKGKIHFTQQYCLKRISKNNRWVEVDWDGISRAKFNSPFPFANWLVIGFIEKE